MSVGGKVMTNYLKEIISYRQWNMMDESYLINLIKEGLCYVSLDFMSELDSARRSRAITKEYVLPDYITNATGYIKGSAAEQLLGDRMQGEKQVCCA
jgi:actin-related protein 6